jgi:NitT/TauT family transport system substrate-binding protein
MSAAFATDETQMLRRGGTVCLLLVLAALCACVGVRDAHAADKVTFVTDFGYNGRHAYYFVAVEKGYYARQNLDVQIVRGQGSADAVKQVAAGTAQIGFADAAAVILGRGNDQIPTRLVAMVYAKPPHAIYVLKESGIAKPKDLEGKKLADTAFSAVPKLFDAYAKAAHIDAGKVTWLVATSDALPAMLTTGRADGIGQFIVGEPLLAKSAAPKEIFALSYADAGLDLYGNGIIASDGLIKSNPDLVRRFVTATMQGLKDAIADPQEAGAIMHKHHREVDTDIATGETKIVGLTGQPLGVLRCAGVKKRWFCRQRLRPEISDAGHCAGIVASARSHRVCTRPTLPATVTSPRSRIIPSPSDRTNSLRSSAHRVVENRPCSS